MNEYEKHCVEVLAENAFWRFAASMPNTMWKYTKKIMMFLTKYDIVNYISLGIRGCNQFQLNDEYFKGLEGTETCIEKFMQRLPQFENLLLENEDFKKFIKYMEKWETIPKYVLKEKKTIEINGKSKDLYQIIANKDFPSLTYDNVACLIKKGTSGGYVESEKNLDQNGKCWIDNFSSIIDSAYVTEDSIINTSIFEETTIKNNAYITKSRIFRSTILNDVEIYNDSYIYASKIIGSIWVDHSSIIYSELKGNIKIKISLFKNKEIY